MSIDNTNGQSLVVNNSDIDALIDKQLEIANARMSAQVGGGVGEETVRTFKRIKLANPTANIGATGLNNTKARKILHFIILLDASGSMSGQRVAVVDGLNSMVSELADDANPDANNIEMSIYLFRGKEVTLMSVVDASGNAMPLANVPIKIFPTITLSDYTASGATPLNKAILSASLNGSLRATMLATGKGRKASTVYLVAVTDGANTEWKEDVNGQIIDYANAVVANVVRDLLKTEEWVFALAFAGSTSAEAIATELAFPLYRNIHTGDSSNNSHNWRSFFSFVSQKIKTASQKVATGQKGSQLIGGNNAQTSVQPTTTLWD